MKVTVYQLLTDLNSFCIVLAVYKLLIGLHIVPYLKCERTLPEKECLALIR